MMKLPEIELDVQDLTIKEVMGHSTVFLQFLIHYGQRAILAEEAGQVVDGAVRYLGSVPAAIVAFANGQASVVPGYNEFCEELHAHSIDKAAQREVEHTADNDNKVLH